MSNIFTIILKSSKINRLGCHNMRSKWVTASERLRATGTEGLLFEAGPPSIQNRLLGSSTEMSQFWQLRNS
ncbi:mCG148209 [Mus musculus]|nr:mCG148209 [Mus musculus]